MTTIAEKLQAIINAKEDIKTAIQNKGVTPTGGLTTYATAIDSITTGGGGNEGDGSNGLDFTVIGYSDEYSKELNNRIDSDFAYTLEAAKKYTSGTDCYKLYEDDIRLVYGPMLDTNNVTIMNYMFRNCYLLQTIPLLDTSTVKSMSGMFDGCSSLTTIPQLDTSNVTNMNGMFANCFSLTTIPQLDTSNVKDMYNMFYGCYSLQSIPLLDTSNVTNIGWFYTSSIVSHLTDIGGFKNLGMQKNLSGTSDNYFITCAPNLTKQSVMNILNNLYNRKSAGYSVLTLKLNANSIALLSDEEIAIATNKGWILS